MSVTRTTAGAQSVSFLVTQDPSEEGPITQFDITSTTWAALPAGKLKDVLDTVYLTEEDAIDPAAFVAAYAAAGSFQVTSTYDDEEVEDSQWYLNAVAPVLPTDPPVGSPVLRVYAQEFGTAVRVSTSYSASE